MERRRTQRAGSLTSRAHLEGELSKEKSKRKNCTNFLRGRPVFSWTNGFKGITQRRVRWLMDLRMEPEVGQC